MALLLAGANNERLILVGTFNGIGAGKAPPHLFISLCLLKLEEVKALLLTCNFEFCIKGLPLPF